MTEYLPGKWLILLTFKKIFPHLIYFATSLCLKDVKWLQKGKRFAVQARNLRFQIVGLRNYFIIYYYNRGAIRRLLHNVEHASLLQLVLTVLLWFFLLRVVLDFLILRRYHATAILTASWHFFNLNLHLVS